ncbi:hypothetical protein T08_8208 [Trichinella sp. T8]|nr:hypothetical protein T08_8208 [Trichinella sp. T8]
MHRTKRESRETREKKNSTRLDSTKSRDVSASVHNLRHCSHSQDTFEHAATSATEAPPCPAEASDWTAQNRARLRITIQTPTRIRYTNAHASRI